MKANLSLCNKKPEKNRISGRSLAFLLGGGQYDVGYENPA